jgi:hypothetical protein
MRGDLGEQIERRAGGGRSRGLSAGEGGSGRYYSSAEGGRKYRGSEGREGCVCTRWVLVIDREQTEDERSYEPD